MYIRRLTIENFRSFAKAKVIWRHFPSDGPLDNITLFIGPTDSGKTSLLQAISIAILAPVIRNSGLRIEFFVRRSAPTNSATIQANLNPSLSSAITFVLLNGSSTESIANNFGPVDAWDGIFQNYSPDFFLVGYGCNRRASNPEGYSEQKRSVRYQRVASLFEDSFGLVPFTLGYQEMKRMNVLDEAREILNQVLPPGLLLTDVTDSERRPLFAGGHIQQPYISLSGAHRKYICWVWDLLVHLARVQSQNSGMFESLTDLPGIVMVDEIDIQHGFDPIPLLSEQFPNLQFLFTIAGSEPPESMREQKDNIRYIQVQKDGSIIAGNEQGGDPDSGDEEGEISSVRQRARRK